MEEVRKGSAISGKGGVEKSGEWPSLRMIGFLCLGRDLGRLRGKSWFFFEEEQMVSEKTYQARDGSQKHHRN